MRTQPSPARPAFPIGIAAVREAEEVDASDDSRQVLRETLEPVATTALATILIAAGVINQSPNAYGTVHKALRKDPKRFEPATRGTWKLAGMAGMHPDRVQSILNDVALDQEEPEQMGRLIM